MGPHNTKTNGYALSVNGVSTTNLTFDLNGNMTSDGTNSYAWDAADRMIKITYPGSNNFSTFVYDGLSRNVSIVETTAGSVTSTKQFVWSVDKKRMYRPCEERDGSGTLTKKFFGRGQMNGATKYFYAKDHLGSVRELTDNSGVIQAEYVFDPYGKVTKISELVPSDFGYAGYYLHSRSGLNLTRTRTYNGSIGRFINRDPIQEKGGTNLYNYVANTPSNRTDPTGLFAGVDDAAIAAAAAAAIAGTETGAEAGAVGGPAGIGIGAIIGAGVGIGIGIYAATHPKNNPDNTKECKPDPCDPPVLQLANVKACAKWCDDNCEQQGNVARYDSCKEACLRHFGSFNATPPPKDAGSNFSTMSPPD